MAENTPAQEEITTPSKFGPDIRLTFIGSTKVQEKYQQLVTPELKSVFPGTNPRSLSFQEYISNSGVPKEEAEKLWDKATENMCTFEVYKSDAPTKGTLLTFMGYEVQYSPIVGKNSAGDRIRHWNEEGYNVVGVRYPEVFDSSVFKEQLLEFVSMADSLDLGKDITVGGLSFGSFALLKAMSLMSNDELQNFFTHVKRLRFHSPPSGKEDLSPSLQKLASLIGEKGFEIHARYLKKPSLAIGSAMERKSFPEEEISDLVVRGPLSETQSGATKGVLYFYRDSAQAGRLKEIFSSPRLLSSVDFATRLKNSAAKPEITFSTSTRDNMVMCENVLRLASQFKGLGYDTKILFIEPLPQKNATPDIGGLLLKYGLSSKDAMVAFIDEPWDGHNPLVLDNLNPALEKLEGTASLELKKTNEPIKINLRDFSYAT